MGKGKLTEQEQKKLRKHKFVMNVTEKRITYSREFKALFAKEYHAGKKPRQIFVDAGFDPQILGPKRIERAAAKWRNLYEEAAENDVCEQ